MIYRGHIDFDKLQPGDVLEDFNLAQDVPGTEILPDIKLTFRKGPRGIANLARVKIQPSWIVEKGVQVTQTPIPPEPTADEKETIYINSITKELAEIATRKPVLVQDSMKAHPALVTASQEVVKALPVEEPIIKVVK